ncbi:MAG: hypothetical protein RIQ49_2742, partial [Pseudomonadota bacterium]
LDRFLDARVVLEAAHRAYRASEADAPAVGVEHRFADLHCIAVCVADIGGGSTRRHGWVSGGLAGQL